ncbi:MAG: hypothetical protein HY462_00755 [Parcubacteria group bacterium]|nr:hypothetical protein [Parcubacteria group bacterium]
MPKKTQGSKVIWAILAVVVLAAAVTLLRGTTSKDARTGPDIPKLVTGEEVPYEVLEVLDEGYRARNAATGEETTLFITPDAPAVFGSGIDSFEDIAVGHMVGVVAYRVAANGIVAEGVAVSSAGAGPAVPPPPSSTPQ